MYLFADLVLILVFLIGSAVLGFLLGRRSFRGRVDQLQEQLQDQRQTVANANIALQRCTTKRVALERELTEVRTHLSGQGIDPATIQREKTPAPETSETLLSVSSTHPGSSTPATSPGVRPPGQRFRRPSTEARRTSSAPALSESDAVKPPSKQDETLQRVRARSSKINFERIGTAEARHRDDLKQINGIGIFIEKKLNALGIYTFAQIARFNEEDQQRVNAAIEFFPGRIARDEWVTQAQRLGAR